MNNNFKELLPAQTINNIKEFFTNLNYTIIVKNLQSPLKDIWWCDIDLIYNNIIILSTHGKGIKKEYCLASGYSELYERYCSNRSLLHNNAILRNRIYLSNFKKYHYYIQPQEKILSIQKSIKQSKKFELFFKNMIDDNKYWLNFFNLIYPQGIPNLPFYSLDNQHIKYFPSELFTNLFGSDGTCAGNSKEEALVQGCSEVCEHYVLEQIYLNNSINYHQVNINNLNISITLKNIITQLKSLYKIYIYDFSYNFSVPVAGILLISKISHIPYLILGSFPIFDIAIERCLTELFQCENITLNLQFNKTYIKSYDIKYKYLYANQFKNTIQKNIVYPENLLLCDNIENNINYNIFLKNEINYSNNDLLIYYTNLFNKLNWEIYYQNLSQSNKIFAYRLYIDNIITINHNKLFTFKNIPQVEKNILWKIIYLTESLLLQNNNIDYKELLNLICYILNYDTKWFYEDIILPFSTPLNYLPNFQKNQGLSIIGLLTMFINLNYFYQIKNDHNICTAILNQFYHYYLLLDYGYYNKNSLTTIKKLTQLYNIQYTKEDYEHYYDIKYLINKIIIEPGYQNLLNF